MLSSASESLASSSTSSILGTTATGKGKRRHVEFKKKPSHLVEDMLLPKNVTNTSSSSVLSTATVTKKDTLPLSTSTVPLLPPVALPPLTTSTDVDKAAATVYMPNSRLPPLSAATAQYISEHKKHALAITKSTATGTAGKATTKVKKQAKLANPKVKKQKLNPIPKVPKGMVWKNLFHVGVIPPEALVTIQGKYYSYGAIAYYKEVGKYKIEFEHSHLKFCIMDMGEGTIYGMKLAAQLKHDRMVQDNLVKADAQRDAYEKFIHAHDRTDNEEHALDSDE
eukprot:scaffold38209_cov55-Attheya_sp.AAC.2